ncbi:MAG: hypothetical protein M1815_004235 [Lichina confinis]|nr:MAG: hypothetical protein M1815_004235 [Lichina confinis]
MLIFVCGHMVRNCPSTAVIDPHLELCRTCSLYSIASAANDLHEKLWEVHDGKLMSDAAFLAQASGAVPWDADVTGDGTMNPNPADEMDLAADDTVRRLSFSHTPATQRMAYMLKTYEDDQSAAKNNMSVAVATWRARWGDFEEPDLRVVTFFRDRMNPDMMRNPPQDALGLWTAAPVATMTGTGSGNVAPVANMTGTESGTVAPVAPMTGTATWTGAPVAPMTGTATWTGAPVAPMTGTATWTGAPVAPMTGTATGAGAGAQTQTQTGSFEAMVQEWVNRGVVPQSQTQALMYILRRQ